MFRLSATFAILLLAVQTSHARAADCPPPGWDKARLETLKASKFEIADRSDRERFAEAIVACLASPDPVLRDQVAFEALSHMMREDQLSPAVNVRIARDLLSRLRGADPNGFARPFAALVLAESVRADRIAAYLPPDLRKAIAEGAIEHLSGITDYRGFDEKDGWRHSVAHGADLAMQIALNPHFDDRAQLARLRDAVGTQIAPSSHFYIYGEPERLMQPIVFLAQRGLFKKDEWNAWFETIGRPSPLETWDDAFQSQAGLAKRHNLRAFLYALWTNARLSKNEDDDVLLSGTEGLLRSVP